MGKIAMLKFLSEKRHARDAEQDHQVYAQLPELIKLQFQAKGFSFLPKQPARSLLTGRHSSKLRGRGLNFEELRHYRSGDDIRTMDWKSLTALASLMFVFIPKSVSATLCSLSICASVCFLAVSNA